MIIGCCIGIIKHPIIKKCSEINLVYVGDFVKNKNIHMVVKAVEYLNKVGVNVLFTAIGKKTIQ